MLTGPVIAINTSGHHNKTLQEQPYDSFSQFLLNSIYIRSGFHW